MAIYHRAIVVSFVATLAACGGGGNSPKPEFTVDTSIAANGSIDPATATVKQDDSTAFTITPAAGFAIDVVTGCGGALVGNVYTTATITADCTISVSFDSIIANAVATANAVLDVAINSAASLDGSASSDPDGDALSFKWTQAGGADVTGGAGFLTGATPAFNTPADVGTVFFELTVNDGNGDSAPVAVQVNVLEHTGPSFYVDGDNGSDTTGDGSRAMPFATLSNAISNITAADIDIYVKSTTLSNPYTETGATLIIPQGTSLYGGYGDNWVRADITQGNNRTILLGSEQAVHFADVNFATFSGFDLRSANGLSPTPYSSIGISAESIGAVGTLNIQDNTIRSGDVLVTKSDAATDSYGLRLTSLDTVRVLRNIISAGKGGNGVAGVKGFEPIDSEKGANASGQTGGNNSTTIGGRSGCAITFSSPDCPSSIGPASQHGGVGGKGGGKNGGNGFPGGNGRKADDGVTPTGALGGTGGSGGGSTNSGGDGFGGAGGNGGRGGNGGNGIGTISAGFYVNNTAKNGANGQHGVGGGGGGGGEGGSLLSGNKVGGGGGGGGGGGVGGEGGKAGGRGGVSIGILLDNIADATVDGNTLSSNDGGNGGAGGANANGSSGGNGGSGRAKVGDGEAGGDGGGGGHAGESGQGGAGGGGPSYTIMVGANIAPVITNNLLDSGNGGAPGTDGLGANGGALGGRDGISGVKGGSGGKVYKNFGRGFEGSSAEGGWSVNIFDANTVDGMTPVLNNNTFTTGTAGNRGTAMPQNF